MRQYATKAILSTYVPANNIVEFYHGEIECRVPLVFFLNMKDLSIFEMEMDRVLSSLF